MSSVFAAVLAQAQDREVVGVDAETVLLDQEVEEWSHVRRWNQSRFSTVLTHEVLMIVVQREVPPPRLTPQVNMMQKSDSSELIQGAVGGGRVDLPNQLLRFVEYF